MQKDNYLSKRFFARLTDEELIAWRPASDDWLARSANVSKANREYRRRAARAGYDSVYSWLRAARMKPFYRAFWTLFVENLDAKG